MRKLRRTMMFVPGNNPGKLQSAGIYGADAVIFDLEDAVAIGEKDTARELVHNAIKEIQYPCEVAVRINHISTPFGYDDLDRILEAKPDIIRLPKAEYADEIREIAGIIDKAEEKHGFPAGSIKLMAAIESAEGILNAREIAKAHPRMTALALGGEDFIYDLQTSRSKEGTELYHARAQIVLAARAAKIDAIDTVLPDIADEETFRREVKLIKQMGFNGKSVVHPRQIEIVHELFTPTDDEIRWARRVVAAYQEALARKSGVIALDGRMIDGPIVPRAERVIAYASAVGKIGGTDDDQCC